MTRYGFSRAARTRPGSRGRGCAGGELWPLDSTGFAALREAGWPRRACDGVGRRPGCKCLRDQRAPYLNRCGDFDAAGELLAFLVGPMAARQSRRRANCSSSTRARRSAENPRISDSPTVATFFVPSDLCASGSCRVHVAFHGCRQSADQIGTAFVTGAGYNEWASANRPDRALPADGATLRLGAGSSKWVFNPRACWDWWGVYGSRVCDARWRRSGAVRAMVKALGRRQ